MLILTDRLIRAVYIGSGCFLDEHDYLAFVRRPNRPNYLEVGEAYTLARTNTMNGDVLFFVHEARRGA